MSLIQEDIAAFEEWWYREGSAYRKEIMDGADLETIVYKMTKIAWLNGADKALELIGNKVFKEDSSMWQTVKKKIEGELVTPGEDEFNILEVAFEAQMSMTTKDMVTEDDDSEWDLAASYTPNHAGIWNKITNINEKCRVVQKNNRIALVQFDNDELNGNLLSRIYRLEDLSKLS